MDKRPPSLPENPALLKQLLADALTREGQYQSSIAALETTVSTQATSISKLEQQNLHQYCRLEQLEAQLRLANQHRFGSSSERHANQIELQFANEAELLADLPPVPGATTAVGSHQRKKSKPRGLPEDLPRVDVHHELSDEEKVCGCGAELKEIGTETSEQLAIIPQVFYVIRHICHKYACRCERAPKTANKPKQPLPGSDLSASLISWSVVAKHLDGLPLYRQEKIVARQGVELTRDKLARAHVRCGEQLEGFYKLLEDEWLNSDIGGCDETALQVLKEKGKAAQSKSSLWIRRGGPPDKPVVLVDYRRNKNKETVEELLDGFSGHLVCDAAACFDHTIKKNGLKRVNCNDHARRKFVEAIKGVKATQKRRLLIAQQAIDVYRRLYRIEARVNQLDPIKKTRVRQRFAVPIWDRFERWARKTLQGGVLHKGTRDALSYLLNHIEGLRRYCEDGRLPISNIHTEHVAKTIAVARKNYLFADTPSGATASGRLFSVLETARANGHNPHEYMTVLLAELPNATTVEEMEALLPWNITPAEIRRRIEAMPRP
jgi:transposase